MMRSYPDIILRCPQCGWSFCGVEFDDAHWHGECPACRCHSLHPRPHADPALTMSTDRYARYLAYAEPRSLLTLLRERRATFPPDYLRDLARRVGLAWIEARKTVARQREAAQSQPERRAA
jgi:hypothetical protein